MPATTPSFGIRKVAVVAARLMVDGEDRGCRFFLVPICTEHGLCPGISSTRLPQRSGTSPLDFALTVFNNVRLPYGALLDENFEKPKDARLGWWEAVSRLQVGSAAVAVPCLKVSFYRIVEFCDRAVHITC